MEFQRERHFQFALDMLALACIWLAVGAIYAYGMRWFFHVMVGICN